MEQRRSAAAAASKNQPQLLQLQLPPTDHDPTTHTKPLSKKTLSGPSSNPSLPSLRNCRSHRRRRRCLVGRKELLLGVLLFMFWYRVMVLLSLFGTRGAKGKAVPAPTTAKPTLAEVENRLRGALWGFLAGDALSAPTHWYYGGARQIVADYGHPITDYTQPNHRLSGSILNKSNLNGGGRSSSWGGGSSHKTTIVGDVINHGKQDLWSPSKSVHYHATLQKGENTLEVSIARVLMKSIVANDGRFDADHFRQAYIDFMTTPDSHNDTYASTCHRMFFANLVHRKLPPKDCPDNDHHNVDTIDGLILPTIAALVDPTAAAPCAGVTRKSRVLEQASEAWAGVVQAAIFQSDDAAFGQTLESFARSTLGRKPNPRVSDSSTMSACYLSQSLPGVVDLIAKYSQGQGVWEALLANANVGGENVHRGSILGAIWGARAGNAALPARLKEGLFPHDELANEIDSFVAAVLPSLRPGCRAETETAP